ncbi:MAG: hypothetical protein K6A70_10720 [Erysipelotrichaceae bacterium]|nr:hypothetical protein [Erysipelotrichaceae bacterium]
MKKTDTNTLSGKNLRKFRQCLCLLMMVLMLFSNIPAYTLSSEDDVKNSQVISSVLTNELISSDKDRFEVKAEFDHDSSENIEFSISEITEGFNDYANYLSRAEILLGTKQAEFRFYSLSLVSDNSRFIPEDGVRFVFEKILDDTVPALKDSKVLLLYKSDRFLENNEVTVKPDESDEKLIIALANEEEEITVESEELKDYYISAAYSQSGDDESLKIIEIKKEDKEYKETAEEYKTVSENFIDIIHLFELKKDDEDDNDSDIQISIELKNDEDKFDKEELAIALLRDEESILIYPEIVEEDDLLKFSFEVEEEVLFAVVQAKEEVTLEYRDREYRIAVTYNAASGIPEDAILKVEEIREEEAIDDYLDKSSQSLQKSKEDLSVIRAFDISLLDPRNNEEYQPDGNVKISIVFEADNLDDYDDLEVLHISDEDAQEAQVMEKTVENDALEFETEAFSVFVILGTARSKKLTASDGKQYQVTVTYDSSSSIPDNAELIVEEIGQDEKSYEDYVNESAKTIGEAAENRLFARAFDISLIDPETKEVYELGENVQVRIQLLDVELSEYENMGVDVIHFHTAEQTEKLDASISEKAVEFTTDGFSVFVVYAYTVDFHWGDYTFSISGEDQITLSELFEELGITDISIEDVAEVSFSNPEYIEIEETADDWLLISIAPFDTVETLTLTLKNGNSIEIKVTDQGESTEEGETVHNPKVSSFEGSYNEAEKTITYTAVVEAEGDMDFGGKQYNVIIDDLSSLTDSGLTFVSGSYTYTRGGEVANSVEFEFPLNITGMKDGDYVTLTYTVKPAKISHDTDDRFKVANTLTITNKTEDGEDNPENNTNDDSASCETSFKYVSLTRQMTALEGSWACWKVEVNPEAYYLDDSGKNLILSDTFDDGIEEHASQSIDYASVSIVPEGSITYDYSGNTGTFVIPDGKAVTITYRTRIKAEPGNSVAFQGTAVLKDSEGKTISTAIAMEEHVIYPSSSDVAGFGTNYMLKLFVYADRQMQTGVSGVNFVLLDANKRPVEYKAGDNAGRQVAFSTGSNGYVDVILDKDTDGVSIEKNTVYYLEMTGVPSAYQKDNTLYSFMITDDPDYNSGGVYTYYNGDTMKVRLYKIQEGLRVTLRFAGNYELTQEQKDNVEVILEKLNYDTGEWTEVERHFNSEAQWGTISFTAELEKDKGYRIVQENERPYDVPENIILTSSYNCTVTGDDVQSYEQEFIPIYENSAVDMVIDNRYEEPKLTLTKMNKETGETLAGAVFTVKKAKDDASVKQYTTDHNGLVVINGGDPYESEVLYYVVETGAPSGYYLPLQEERTYFYFCNDEALIPQILEDLPEGETAVNLTKTYDSLTIDDQKQLRTIPVMKIWQGNTWPAVVSNVVVGLYQSTGGSDPVPVTDGSGNARTIVLTEIAPYNNTAFKDLPTRDSDGKTITYSIKEIHVYNAGGDDLINNYVQEYGVSDAGVYVVRNRTATSLTVCKEWYDKESGEKIIDFETLAQQPDVFFDVYRTLAKMSDEIKEDGITNEEMTAFVAGLQKVRSDLSFGNSDGWIKTISDLEEKDDAGNPYYYYILESVPSFSEEDYEVNEDAKTATIKNKTLPDEVSLTVAKAALVNDPRPEASDTDFIFTLRLEKGNRPIRNYTVYSVGATRLVTDSDGEVSFTLKPENNIGLTLPKGVKATVTEAYNSEYEVRSEMTDPHTKSGRVFEYTVEKAGSVTFTNTLRVICKVVDKNGITKPYESLKSALDYIRNNPDTYIDGVATIEMLKDYEMPDTDIFDVRADENIVLTTATTDPNVEFHFETDRTEDTDTAYITRGSKNGSLLSNLGTLTLQNVRLDGANKNITVDGGLISSSGTLNLKDDAALCNSTVNGKGGAIYSSGPLNMEDGAAVFANSATNGSAIYLASGTMKMSGGSIENNTVVSDGAVVITGSANIELSGAPVVYGNSKSGNDAANLYIGVDSDRAVYVVGSGLSESAHIGVSAMEGHRELGEQFATTVAGVTGNLNRFVNDRYGYRGKVKDGTTTNVVWDGLTLKISKVADSKGSNPNDSFVIILTSTAIKKSNYIIDGTVDYTITPASSRIPGVIVLRSVKPGRDITISPLPVGEFKIEEEESDYTPSFSGENTETSAAVEIVNGTFNLEGNSTITVINTRRLADVSLSKSLQDRLASGTVSFPFAVILNDKDGSAVSNYELAEGITTDNNGEASFVMSPSNTETAIKEFTVPVGSTMNITETDNSDYRISAGAKTKEGQDIADQDSEHDNIFIFTVTDEGADVSFSNVRKMATIELRKDLIGKVSKAESFSFKLTMENRDGSPAANYVLYEDEDPSKNIVTDADGKVTVPFGFGEDETSKSVALTLPEGSDLKIDEEVVKKEIDGVEQEIYDTAISKNGGAASEGTTIDIEVKETDSSVVFTNTRKMKTVTVTNTVAGYSGNVVPFSFTASVTDGSDNDYDLNGFKDGEQTFELATGQSKTLIVPYGATLNVTEEFIIGYETLVKHGNQDQILATSDEFVIKEDVTVAFTNNQLINIVIVNNTSQNFENIQIYTVYATKMYRVNEAGTGQEPVTVSNHWAAVNVDAGKTAILEVNHQSSQTYEQAYSVKGNAPSAGYYYTINNEPSYHEFADPAVLRIYDASAYEVKGKLRYSTSDSTITFSEQPLVSFDVNGGAWTTEMDGYHDKNGDRQIYQIAVDKGSSVSEPDPDPIYPTAEEIAFLGWTKDVTFAKESHTAGEDVSDYKYNFDTKVEEPLTLYAIWAKQARDTHVVTVSNSHTSGLTVSVTLTGAEGPISEYTIFDSVTTDEHGQASFVLPSNDAKNLTIPKDARLEISVNPDATGVSSQFNDADTADNSFTISSVNRDGTVTFIAGVCKITDADGNILYDGEGNPTVYATLGLAFSAYNGTLYSDAGHTREAIPAAVKMLIDEYEITSKHGFPSKDVIVTTAGKNDADFPYVGTRAQATLLRGSAYNNDTLFTHEQTATSVTFRNIILDGNNVKLEKKVNGGLIYMKFGGAVLNIDGGTILRNVQYIAYDSGNQSNAGAIYIQGGTLNVMAGLFSNLHARRGGAIAATDNATVTISGTNGSTRFVNCRSDGDDGGAINYRAKNNFNNFTVNGGTDRTNPGIIFTDCQAFGNESDGGAIYVESGIDVSISGCIFTECSSRNTKGKNDEGFGGGAIGARGINAITVSNSAFNSCDTLKCGGAVMARLVTSNEKNNKAASIVNCTFDNCSCKGQGGAVAVYQDNNSASESRTELYIKDSNFNSCSSGTDNGSGGAIQSYVPCMYFDNTDFTDCWAGKEGGAFNNWYGGDSAIWPNSYMTVINCDFIRCRAEDRYLIENRVHYGGAIATKAETLLIEDSYFKDCVSTLREGGAVHCSGFGDNSTATVKNTEFINCQAKTNGGAFMASSKTLTIENSRFYGCSSFAENGGAVYHGQSVNDLKSGSSTVISNCVFSKAPDMDNSESCSAAKDGGAIWSKATTVTISDCNMTGTMAGKDGGAILARPKAGSSITNCEITDCSAVRNGGAIYESNEGNSSIISFINGTIKNCKAENGSAVYVENNAAVTFSDIEITENTVSSINSGAVHDGGGDSKLFFENNVKVENNTCSNDSSCKHDVLMHKNNNNDSNMTVVQTTSNGMGTEAHVGIYIPDSIFERRGTEGKVFGIHGSENGNQNLDCFFNDRDSELFGFDVSNNSYIYWGHYVCKITDADGNTLKRANGKDAVYHRLTAALDDFTQVKDDSGETGKAVYIKMLVETYNIFQEDTISNFPVADVTLTTAGKNEPDDKYPYSGTEGTVCTISRSSSDTGTNQLFKLDRANAAFRLENITLDGRKDKTASTGVIRLIEATNGKIVINGGTTLQYGNCGTGNGGAVYISNEAASLEINSTSGKDVVFDNCITADNSGGGGGAIWTAGDLSITSDGTAKTIFIDCHAARGGAVMQNGNKITSVNGAKFIDCYSLYEGGAFYHNNNGNNSSTTIKKSDFENCYTASNDQWSYGGAVNSKAKVLTVEECNFKNCYSKSNGGAINHGAHETNKTGTTIINTSFENCYTAGTNMSYGYGGSVSASSKNVNIQKCVFKNSTSYNRGGALYCQSNHDDSTTVISGTSFENCSATRTGEGYGGAIYCGGDNKIRLTIQDHEGVSTEITKCFTTDRGGAVYLEKEKSELNIFGSTTISGCYAKTGAAVYLKNNEIMNIKDSPEFTQNGYISLDGTIKNAEKGACIYLEQGSKANITGSPKFSRNNITNLPRIVNGGITDYVRQDIYLAGYANAEANSINVNGELTGDTIWIWPENSPHRLSGEQFAITAASDVSAISLGKLRNALADDDTGCSNGEYLAGVRLSDKPNTKVYWSKMYNASFKKIDNKAVEVAGAEFTLYTDSDCTDVFASAHSADGETDTSAQGELLDKGMVDFISIPIGAYYMKESRTPSSYIVNNTKYLVLVGSPYLSNTESSRYLWIDGGPLDVPNAEDLVIRSTINSGKYYGIFPLNSDGKADLSKNLALLTVGIINVRDDHEAYFMKVDGSEKALPGAQFTVYYQPVDAQGNPVTYENGYPVLNLWSRDGETYPDPVTSADGTERYKDREDHILKKGLVYFRELPKGTYYLLETYYPDRNGDNRKSFFVETDTVLKLTVIGETEFTLEKLKDDNSGYEPCAKDEEDHYYVVGNTEAVSKLTDGSDKLLYRIGRDGKTLLPAIYSSLDNAFDIAQNTDLVFYYADGQPAADLSSMKIKALKDSTLSAKTVNSTRMLTFTTAETVARNDRYVFSTNRTSDTSRAEIKRNDTEGSLFTIGDNEKMILQNINLNGQGTSGRAVDVNSGGSLDVLNNTRIQSFEDTDGAAIRVADNSTLKIDGGFTNRSAQFNNNKATKGSGGAVSVGKNCTVEIKNAQFAYNTAAVSGGAVHIDSNNNITLEKIVMTYNSAQTGSAICSENDNQLTIVDATIRSNVSSAANGGAINTVGVNNKLYFGGNSSIYDNYNSDRSEQRNVVLSVDSNNIIHTTASGLRGGKIGVYVIDGENGDIFRKHGLPETPFGTFNSDSNLSVFVNDRYPGLYGGKNELDDTDKKIYWHGGERKVILRKTTSANMPLAGAKFTIYRTDKKTKVSGVDIYNNIETTTFTSNEQGVYFVGKLIYGTYYICETTTPDGYQKLSDGNNWFKLIVEEKDITIERLGSSPL